MIDMKLWKELISKWEKVGKCYQIPRRGKERLEHFSKVCIPELAGRKVLEIGCNSGLHALTMDSEVKSYLGIEPGNLISKKGKKAKTDYYKQAQITQKYLKNGKFLNATIKQFTALAPDSQDYDTFLAIFALYHFTNEELKLLEKRVFPKCDLVVIQNRSQDRPTRHNSYKFWKHKNIVKYFTALGFTNIQVIKGPKNKFAEIICKKPSYFEIKVKDSEGKVSTRTLVSVKTEEPDKTPAQKIEEAVKLHKEVDAASVPVSGTTGIHIIQPGGLLSKSTKKSEVLLPKAKKSIKKPVCLDESILDSEVMLPKALPSKVAIEAWDKKISEKIGVPPIQTDIGPKAGLVKPKTKKVVRKAANANPRQRRTHKES